MFLEFNDLLVRGEKQELFKRCFIRCYAAVNVSYKYEKAKAGESGSHAPAGHCNRGCQRTCTQHFGGSQCPMKPLPPQPRAPPRVTHRRRGSPSRDRRTIEQRRGANKLLAGDPGARLELDRLSAVVAGVKTIDLATTTEADADQPFVTTTGKELSPRNMRSAIVDLAEAGMSSQSIEEIVDGTYGVSAEEYRFAEQYYRERTTNQEYVQRYLSGGAVERREMTILSRGLEQDPTNPARRPNLNRPSAPSRRTTQRSSIQKPKSAFRAVSYRRSRRGFRIRSLWRCCSSVRRSRCSALTKSGSSTKFCRSVLGDRDNGQRTECAIAKLGSDNGWIEFSIRIRLERKYASRGNSIFSWGKYLMDPQQQNSYGYARDNPIKLR